jgi:O-antigen/teichoic acid export membrane protein
MQLYFLFKSFSWIVFDKILRVFTSLVFISLLASALLPEKFGTFNLIFSGVAIFSSIASWGLLNLFKKLYFENVNDRANILNAVITLQILISIIVSAIYLIFGYYLQEMFKVDFNLVLVSIFLILFKPVEIGLATMEANEKFDVVAKVNISLNLTFFIIKCGALFSKQSLPTYVIIQTSEIIVTNLIIFKLSKIKFKFNQLIENSQISYSQLLTDGGKLMLSGLAVTVYMRIDQIMIGTLIDHENLGLYSAAIKLGEFPYFVGSIISVIIFKRFFDDDTDSREAFLQVCYSAITILAVVISLTMCFAAGTLVNFVFGPEYVQSASILSLHAVTIIFVYIGLLNVQILISENQLASILYRTIMGCVINIILNAFLIPYYGIIGAVIATIASQFYVAYLYDIKKGLHAPINRYKFRAFSLHYFTQSMKILRSG